RRSDAQEPHRLPCGRHRLDFEEKVDDRPGEGRIRQRSRCKPPPLAAGAGLDGLVMMRGQKKFCLAELRPGTISTVVVLLLAGGLFAADAKPDAAKLAFFESRIRPVLVESCYECHNSADKAEGSLALDFRDGIVKGGDRGPAIVPGKGKVSLLV